MAVSCGFAGACGLAVSCGLAVAGGLPPEITCSGILLISGAGATLVLGSLTGVGAGAGVTLVLGSFLIIGEDGLISKLISASVSGVAIFFFEVFLPLALRLVCSLPLLKSLFLDQLKLNPLHFGIFYLWVLLQGLPSLTEVI